MEYFLLLDMIELFEPLRLVLLFKSAYSNVADLILRC